MDGNGLERWRGGTDERLASLEEDIVTLFNWRSGHERDTGLLSDRLARIEVKVAGFAALGAVGGGVVVAVITWLLGKL